MFDEREVVVVEFVECDVVGVVVVAAVGSDDSIFLLKQIYKLEMFLFVKKKSI